MGLSGLVSDGAKALVKLALSGLGWPDMFHLLYALSKSIGSAIARQQVQLQNSTKAYKRNSKRSHLLPPSLRCQPKSQYYKPNRTNWKSTVKTISKIYTPCPKLFTFDLNTGESQFGFELPTRLQSILANVERLGQTYAPTRAAAIDVWQRQIPHLSGTFMPGGSGPQALCSQTQDPDTQHWVLTILLPWVYWHQQTEKTRHTELKQGYHQATQAHARFLAHSFTHTETLATAVD